MRLAQPAVDRDELASVKMERGLTSAPAIIPDLPSALATMKIWVCSLRHSAFRRVEGEHHGESLPSVDLLRPLVR